MQAEASRRQEEASRRQELLLQAILRHVSGGGNSQVNLPFASNGVNDAATAPTTATPTQFNHTHDDSNDDSNKDADAVKLDMNGELQLGTSEERTNSGGVEIVSIVSPAAAASSTKKTTSNQGKNNQHTELN